MQCGRKCNKLVQRHLRCENRRSRGAHDDCVARQATAKAAIGRLREAGAQMAGSEVVGSAMGAVLFEKP